ncbi:spore germination cell wall hydrolase CwlJ-like protein [Sphingomonas sp. F9_3S_D5_B_2]
MPKAATLVQPLTGLKFRLANAWRVYPRETLGFGLLAMAAAVAIGGAAQSTPELPGRSAAHPEAQLPAAPPLLVRQLAPDQALKVNADIPVDNGPNPAAAAFAFKGNAAAKTQALSCLASAVYYEAGSQDDDGERAVAQVVLNRVRHPAFPSSVCAVVYEGSTRPTGCQFTFTCDGSLYRRPDAAGWRRAYLIAEQALDGAVFAPVGWATHYHANYVVPYWASTLTKNAVVGAHIFYRWAGTWGSPAAFNERYAGREPNAVALRDAAVAAAASNAAARGQSSTVVNAVAEIPGAEAIQLEPSMRGDKKVAVRFNLVGHKAAEEAPHEDYTKKFEATDNLKWALSSEVAAKDEKPLGSTAAPGAASTSPVKP